MADRAERTRLIRLELATERAELVLAMNQLRVEATPARLARSLGGGFWQALLHRGAQGGGPAALALIGALKRYPMLASALTALLPFARRFVMRRLTLRRVLWGSAAAAAGWIAYKAVQR